MSNNGLFSFGGPFFNYSAVDFPIEESVVAPFWDDIDVREGGSIFYEIHSCTSFNARSLELLQHVSYFISEVEGVSFLGSWMLVGMWEDVPEYDGSASVVR